MLITLGGEVDRCRERAVGTGLGVLSVCPLYLEVLDLVIVWQVLLTRFGDLVVEVETSRIFVSSLVVGLSRHTPRTLGEYFSCELEVHVVVEGEIVTTIAQVESSFVLISIGWHDESR